MKTYEALSGLIKAEKTVEGLRKLEKRVDRHYNNGTLTVSEFRRLDLMIFERLAKATA